MFSSPEVGPKIAAVFMSEILNIPVADLVDALEIRNNNIRYDGTVVGSEIDLNYETYNSKIDIELNMKNSEYSYNKNFVYTYQLLLHNIKNNKDYKNMKPVYQINIDGYDYFKKNDLMYYSTLMEVKYHIIENSYINIYHFNVLKVIEMDYNILERNEIAKILFLLTCKDEELTDKMIKGDEFLMAVKKEIQRISGEKNWADMFLTNEEIYKIEADESYQKGMEKGIEEGIEEGFKQGITKGIEQGANNKQIEIAKNMLNLNIEIDTIIKVTGLTKEVIESLNK